MWISSLPLWAWWHRHYFACETYKISPLSDLNIIPKIMCFNSCSCTIRSLQSGMYDICTDFAFKFCIIILGNINITIALDCRELIIDILIVGPSLITKCIWFLSKWTKLFPLFKNKLTDDNLHSTFGTIKTSSSVSNPMILFLLWMWISIVPKHLHWINEPSTRKIALFVRTVAW